jgi:hypothetical protein
LRKDISHDSFWYYLSSATGHLNLLTTTTVLQHAPKVVQKAGIGALLVDQLSPAEGTVADYLDIPFISVSAALMINEDVSVPPCNPLWDWMHS